jgi:hypothetical protein
LTLVPKYARTAYSAALVKELGYHQVDELSLSSKDLTQYVPDMQNNANPEVACSGAE